MESRLDGRTFVKFHIDVGIGDVILEPVETITTRDWLAFAEIPSPSVMMTTREQQFAEKIHAYTLPRSSPNSRVRDLVDLYLLIASGSLNLVLCAEALRRTFERRRTHGIPEELVPPQRIGVGRFVFLLTEECRLHIGYRAAFDALLGFWNTLAR